MNYQNNEIGYIGFIHLMSRLKGKKGSETMSIKSFDELLALLRPHMSRSNTSIRLAISAEEIQ